MQNERREIGYIQWEKQLIHCGLSPVSQARRGRGRKRRDSGGRKPIKLAEVYHYGVSRRYFNIIQMKRSYKEKSASEVKLRIWYEKSGSRRKVDFLTDS